MYIKRLKIPSLLIIATLLSTQVAFAGKKPKSGVYRGLTIQGTADRVTNTKKFDFSGNDLSTIAFQYDLVTPQRIKELIAYDPANQKLEALFDSQLVSVIITPKALAQNYGQSGGFIGSLAGSIIANARANSKPHEQFHDTKLQNPKDLSTVCRAQNTRTDDFTPSTNELLMPLTNRRDYNDSKYLNSRYAIVTYDPSCFTKEEKTEMIIVANGYGDAKRGYTYKTIPKKLKKQIKSDFGLI